MRNEDTTARIGEETRAVDELTQRVLAGDKTLTARQLAIVLAGGERELKRIEARMLREALGADLYALCRDADAQKARDARKAANKSDWRRRNGRLGGWLSGIARRNKRDGMV